jgi:uncharacterized membrane protein
MRKAFIVLLLGGTLGWLSGCGDTVQSLMGPYQNSISTDTLSFAQVRPILLEKCAICHNEYNDSAKIANKSASRMYSVVYDYSMPASGVAQLAPQDRVDLLKWLKQMKDKNLGGGNGG